MSTNKLLIKTSWQVISEQDFFYLSWDIMEKELDPNEQRFVCGCNGIRWFDTLLLQLINLFGWRADSIAVANSIKVTTIGEHPT